MKEAAVTLCVFTSCAVGMVIAPRAVADPMSWLNKTFPPPELADRLPGPSMVLKNVMSLLPALELKIEVARSVTGLVKEMGPV